MIELNLNQTLRDAALEQAGVVNDEFNFTLSNFTYNISIVTDQLKKHLQDTNFIGVSVNFSCMFEALLGVV